MSVPVRIELLRAPDCPHADATRRDAHAALRHLQRASAIVERVGSYPSPTLVVDGLDVVTGRPPARGDYCRLDRPTRTQITQALERAGGSSHVETDASGDVTE
ncbi:MAG TPA: hypothetical protein VFM58_20965 [Solirubrobacteraceae bacterium]|nr:hypothetical protein [Solirubrobacteraceae bacterium]